MLNIYFHISADYGFPKEDEELGFQNLEGHIFPAVNYEKFVVGLEPLFDSVSEVHDIWLAVEL